MKPREPFPPDVLGLPTAERRSPAAWRHDPPVRSWRWVTDRGLALEGFLEDARLRCECDDVGWDRLLRHAGMHLDRRRFEPESPPSFVPAGTHVAAYLATREPEPVALGAEAVLLDEQGVVAVDKPAWLTTQGSRASRHSSLERVLRRLLGCPTLVPIHRLDRETSGVVLFARDGAAAGALGRQLERRTLRKEYLAVVSPAPAEASWAVDGALVRALHPSHSLFELAGPDDPRGRSARTGFERLEVEGERALVRALPVTGRTHQIRVHLRAGGTPIVGDSLYGGGYGEGRPWSAQRLQLHAASVRYVRDGREVVVVAPTPQDFGLHAT